MNPEKLKVLILGVATVQADAIELLISENVETFACAQSADGLGAEIVDHFVEINFLEHAEVCKFVEDNDIDVVYSVGSDLASPISMLISEQMDKPHFVSFETASICNNKGKMRDTLADISIGNIAYQSAKTLDELDFDKIVYPSILKPIDSQGQRGVIQVNNRADIERSFEEVQAYSRTAGIIVEEYIEGPEYSVNGYLVDGELKFLLASDRNTWPQYTGLIHRHIIPSRYLTEQDHNAIHDVVQEACKILNINNGPVYAQMKVKDGRPYIIEITPRLDGCHMWKLINQSTGLNLLRLTFRHLLMNDLSELDKVMNIQVEPAVLTFFCQEPHTVMDQAKFTIPDKAHTHCFYYHDGEEVRPVNNVYEKVGYYISSEII